MLRFLFCIRKYGTKLIGKGITVNLHFIIRLHGIVIVPSLVVFVQLLPLLYAIHYSYSMILHGTIITYCLRSKLTNLVAYNLKEYLSKSHMVNFVNYCNLNSLLLLLLVKCNLRIVCPCTNKKLQSFIPYYSEGLKLCDFEGVQTLNFLCQLTSIYSWLD